MRSSVNAVGVYEMGPSLTHSLPPPNNSKYGFAVPSFEKGLAQN